MSYKQINILWLRVNKATSSSFIKNISKKIHRKERVLSFPVDLCITVDIVETLRVILFHSLDDLESCEFFSSFSSRAFWMSFVRVSYLGIVMFFSALARF